MMKKCLVCDDILLKLIGFSFGVSYIDVEVYQNDRRTLAKLGNRFKYSL